MPTPRQFIAGLEALNMLQPPETVDLVLTDVMMPFLDGFGLLKQLRYLTCVPV
jgi:CheY-like chemotaxis protein